MDEMKEDGCLFSTELEDGGTGAQQRSAAAGCHMTRVDVEEASAATENYFLLSRKKRPIRGNQRRVHR